MPSLSTSTPLPLCVTPEDMPPSSLSSRGGIKSEENTRLFGGGEIQIRATGYPCCLSVSISRVIYQLMKKMDGVVRTISLLSILGEQREARERSVSSGTLEICF